MCCVAGRRVQRSSLRSRRAHDGPAGAGVRGDRPPARASPRGRRGDGQVTGARPAQSHQLVSCFDEMPVRCSRPCFSSGVGYGWSLRAGQARGGAGRRLLRRACGRHARIDSRGALSPAARRWAGRAIPHQFSGINSQSRRTFTASCNSRERKGEPRANRGAGRGNQSAAAHTLSDLHRPCASFRPPSRPVAAPSGAHIGKLRLVRRRRPLGGHRALLAPGLCPRLRACVDGWRSSAGAHHAEAQLVVTESRLADASQAAARCRNEALRPKPSLAAGIAAPALRRRPAILGADDRLGQELATGS